MKAHKIFHLVFSYMTNFLRFVCMPCLNEDFFRCRFADADSHSGAHSQDIFWPNRSLSNTNQIGAKLISDLDNRLKFQKSSSLWKSDIVGPSYACTKSNLPQNLLFLTKIESASDLINPVQIKIKTLFKIPTYILKWAFRKVQVYKNWTRWDRVTLVQSQIFELFCNVFRRNRICIWSHKSRSDQDEDFIWIFDLDILMSFQKSPSL